MIKLEIIQQIESALHKGFINKDIVGNSQFKPELLINNENDKTVLHSLLEELENCQSFLFSVAFITESGLATLKTLLHDLKHKGIKGRILTSTYLHFNKPKMFEELLKFDNIEVRLTDMEGFHSKGYIFEHDTHYSFIVGSSNLTANALKVNFEWNIKLTSYENGEVIHHFKEQFEKIWSQSISLDQKWIDMYAINYVTINPTHEIQKIVEFPGKYNENKLINALRIKPNKMQQVALEGIDKIRNRGVDRGLVISATGTGKTYLAAFDVRNYQPRKMLFIVHREQILQKAKADFMEILGGDDRDYGILSGTTKQYDAKYLFATVQTISQDKVLETFVKDYFDYILIDEVHKAGAKSYLKVIDYFRPNFLLGLTATPDRTDDFNIYGLFNYNIAYEIRLQEALEDGMLCPFHYFGVTDYILEGEIMDDTVTLSNLVTEERFKHILEKINYYGYSGDILKGLIFCSRNEEAVELSILFNEKGYRTVALSGSHSQEERLKQVERLENGTLDYIITVDIFNEGIDIPSVNQIIMLRQTQSSIIFIQQLGRGLRKHHSKDYVTIIDFIGNYKSNYLIPVALSGDGSQNKDNIRRHLQDTSYIKGVSTINFEEVAKKQIYKSIDTTNLTQLRILREAYEQLKNRVGRTPRLMDFINHNSVDPQNIVKREGNYYKFLIKLKEEVAPLQEYDNQILTMFSLEFLNGKRLHEIVLLQLLLEQESVSKTKYKKSLKEYGCYIDENTYNSIKRVFELSFFTRSDIKKYGEKPIVIFDQDEIQLNSLIRERLKESATFKSFVVDIIETAFLKHQKYHSNKPLTIHEKYTKKDVCRLLNWHKDEKGTMYGYRTKHGTCPIFITYHKREIEDSINYGDELLNRETLRWFTKNNRTLASKEVREIVQAKKRGIDIHIFVKKDDDEGTDFYYLGTAEPDNNTIVETTMVDAEKELPVVKMNLKLKNSLTYNLYKYLTSLKE